MTLASETQLHYSEKGTIGQLITVGDKDILAKATCIFTGLVGFRHPKIKHHKIKSHKATEPPGTGRPNKAEPPNLSALVGTTTKSVKESVTTMEKELTTVDPTHLQPQIQPHTTKSRAKSKNNLERACADLVINLNSMNKLLTNGGREMQRGEMRYVKAQKRG